MAKTAWKLHPKYGSCVRRRKKDEPYFVLLGRDPLAPGAIRDWIAAIKASVDNVGEQPAAKLRNAESISKQMERWRKKNSHLLYVTKTAPSSNGAK